MLQYQLQTFIFGQVWRWFGLSVYCSAFRKPGLWNMRTSRACSPLITLINIFGIDNIPDDLIRCMMTHFFFRMTKYACWLHKSNKLWYFAGILTLNGELWSIKRELVLKNGRNSCWMKRHSGKHQKYCFNVALMKEEEILSLPFWDSGLLENTIL